jgi:hypothetical protein
MTAALRIYQGLLFTMLAVTIVGILGLAGSTIGLAAWWFTVVLTLGFLGVIAAIERAVAAIDTLTETIVKGSRKSTDENRRAA